MLVKIGTRRIANYELQITIGTFCQEALAVTINTPLWLNYDPIKAPHLHDGSMVSAVVHMFVGGF
ncbi:hypothetical protein BH11PSE12_BH11PSE12_33640 [soil metagenome]